RRGRGDRDRASTTAGSRRVSEAGCMMSAVLLQLDRRTIGLAGVQSACIAVAMAIAASAGTRAGAHIMTGNHAVGVVAGALAAAAVAGSRAIFTWLMRRLGPRERLLVIGSTEASLT